MRGPPAGSFPASGPDGSVPRRKSLLRGTHAERNGGKPLRYSSELSPEASASPPEDPDAEEPDPPWFSSSPSSRRS